MISSQDAVDRFYQILSALESLPNQSVLLRETNGEMPWPDRGVFFFREPGELRSTTPSMGRVTYVGTHGVSANAKSSLWSRLRAHRGAESGSGNHRGSVLRLHVGAALLSRDGRVDQVPSWGNGSSAPPETRALESEHERGVSEYLGRMSVLWVDVPDAPGAESDRKVIVRNSVALLSNSLRPIDPPGAQWLGRHSPRIEIRKSGLWNVNHVEGPVDESFLNVLRLYVPQTTRATLPRS